MGRNHGRSGVAILMFKVIADNGNSRTVETRSQAEEIAEDMESLGMSVEINQLKETDGGKAEVVETPATGPREEQPEPESTDAPSRDRSRGKTPGKSDSGCSRASD